MFASKDLFFTRPSGYQISRSVRTRSSASAYFNRTPASASNQKTWTWSGWVKRGTLGTRQNIFGASTGGSSDSQYCLIAFTAGDAITAIASNSGTVQLDYTTSALFRDPSAWYHFVIYFDAANTTFRIYVNGVLQTLTTSTAISNVNYSVNSAVQHNIGKDVRATTNTSYVDGYLTEINFVDGQALTPSSFGQTNTVTGVWQPIKYTGTYGTNGYYLNFSDNSNNTATTIGKDNSGNGNNWTPNNISVTAGTTYDSMLDVPTLYADGGNGRGNYCTMNPLSMDTAAYTLSNANLNFAGSRTATATYYARSTIGVSSGKWYWEITPTDVGGGPNIIVGIQDASTTATTGSANLLLNGYGYGADGYKNNTAGQTAGYGATWTNGDVIGVALDLDAGTITFYKNNTSQGVAYSSISGTYCPVISMSTGGVARTIAGSINFGQRPFTYTPPTGFVALNTQNLPTPTISNGANYMAATTYAGSASTQVINSNLTSLNFAWIKDRTSARSHVLVDTVRSGSPMLTLYSDLTSAEDNSSPNYNPTSISGSSITLAGAKLGINNAGDNYVMWGWSAGSSNVTNTSGSITSTVSAGATQGFSVVTWTQAAPASTIGHGLGVAPNMIIVKQRNVVNSWYVRHSSITAGNDYALILNSTAAATNTANIWNNTAPTSTVFSIGTAWGAGTMVAYCFSAVAGYSAFGSYAGNGSTDGPFVYCGFRPRFVMWKDTTSTSAGSDWFMFDTSRNTYNTLNNELAANLSSAENIADGGQLIDILSNGFKPRMNSYGNASGATNIYVAFAENPFKYSLAR